MNGPIPGESLTKPQKQFPWERPPEISDPEEAILMHLGRLEDAKRMNSILDALEYGDLDLYSLVKGLMRSATANGIHSIDVGLLAAPVVHEFIKRTADEVGIEYDEGLEDLGEEERTQDMRTSAEAAKKLKEMNFKVDSDFDRDEEDTSDMIEEEIEVETEEPSMGLMSKRG